MEAAPDRDATAGIEGPGAGRKAAARKPEAVPGLRARRSSSSLLLGFGGLLIAVVLGVTANLVWQGRQLALAEAGRELLRLDLALAAHAESALQGVDLVLQSTARWAARLIPAERTAPGRLHDVLRGRIGGVPQIGSVVLLDSDGDPWLDSRAYPPPAPDSAVEHHLAVHRDRSAAGLHITAPQPSAADPRPSFSRGVYAADGRLLGVAVALLERAHFVPFHRRISRDRDGTVALVHADGSVLLRYPQPERGAGGGADDRELLARLIAQPGSTLRARSADGVDRIYAVQRLGDYPVAVIVSASEEAALSEWREYAWRVGGGAALACLLIGALFLVLAREMRQRERLGGELALSEARYRELVQSAGAIIIRLDLDGRVTFFNDYAERFFGFPREEVVGWHVTETFVPPRAADGRDLGALVDTVLAAPEDHQVVEYESVCKDGTRVWVRWSNRAIRDENGIAVGVLTVGTDVTERKRAEQELLRTQSAIDKSLDPVFWVKSRGELVYVNRAACEKLGWSRDELLQKTVFDIDPLFPRETWDEHWRNTQGREAYVIETAHRSRDGRVFPVEISITRMRDPNGEYHHCVARDLTERKRAEEALRRFKTTLDLTQDCVFMFDPQTLRFFYVNRGAMDQVGYSEEELLRMTPVDIKPDFDEARFREMIAPMLAGERPAISLETRHRHRDGHDVQVEIMLQYVAPAGEAPRFVAVVRDITERKRAEEALRRLNAELEERVAERTRELEASNAQLKETVSTLQRARHELVRSEKLAGLGSLVAGMAHELSTPLGNSLMVATTLAERTRSMASELERGSVRRSSLNDYVSQAEQASALLTRSLLQASELIGNFKQVAVDQTSAQRRRFDLAGVLAEVVATLQPRFRRSPHRIELAVPADIAMDSFPGPLGQVVTNLVINSLMHGLDDAQRPGVVTVAAAPPAGGRVRLSVQDNGAGIPAENLSRIFDPFFTTRMGRGGTGLGLHIVHSIVELVLGGRIEVASEPGVGTCFTLDLPLVAPAKPAGQSWESVGVA